MIEKIFPFIKRPEVKEKDAELAQSLEVEQKVYDYLVLREEMLSIWQDASEFISPNQVIETYESLKRKKATYQKEITKLVDKYKESTGKEVTEENINKVVGVPRYQKKIIAVEQIIAQVDEMLAAEESEPARKGRMSMTMGKQKMQKMFKTEGRKSKKVSPTVFSELAKSSPAFLLLAVKDGIKSQKMQEYEEQKDEAKDEKMKKELKKTKNYEVIGQTKYFSKVLNLHYSKILESLDEIIDVDEKEMQKMENFLAKQGAQKAKASEKVKSMKKEVEVAKVSGHQETIRSSEVLGSLYDVSEDEVMEEREMLQDVFELDDDFEFLEKNVDESGKAMVAEETHEEWGNLVEKDFISACTNYKGELKRMNQLLREGRVVETDYVKDIIERALPQLRKQPPSIVYFHGDFGTGKTAIAVHIARTRLNKEPIIVAGNKFIDPEKFTEEYRINKKKIDEFLNEMNKDLGINKKIGKNTSVEEIISSVIGTKEDLKTKIISNRQMERYIAKYMKDEVNDMDEKEKQEYFKKNVDQEKLIQMSELTQEELASIDSEIDSTFENQVQGRYVLGAMYQAMKEGRPLIMDEANAISPDVLIAFNDLLTKKVGDKIYVQSDEGEIKVKEGYCIIWTGNTGKRYKQARFNDVDPASYSRINPIKVAYLPQSREVSSMANLLERLESETIAEKAFNDDDEMMRFIKETKENAKGDQIFQILLIKLLNNMDGATMLVKKNDRYSVIKDLYRLSMGARIMMDLFEGNTDAIPNMPHLQHLIGTSTAAALSEKLKKTNLSIRELTDNIIAGYIDSGFALDLEYYLFNFVRKYASHPEEQAIAYAVLSQVGMFNLSDGWPDYNSARDLNEFQNLMGFDPIAGINKYKKIDINGEYYPMLDIKDDYEYAYLSSYEVMQLVFGYLPPRKVEEYQAMQKDIEAIESGNEVEKKREELLNDIKEIVDNLTEDSFDTMAEVETIQDKALVYIEKIENNEFLSNASDEDFWKQVEGLADVLIEFLQSESKISEEDAEKLKSMDAAEKIKLVKDILKK